MVSLDQIAPDQLPDLLARARIMAKLGTDTVREAVFAVLTPEERETFVGMITEADMVVTQIDSRLHAGA